MSSLDQVFLKVFQADEPIALDSNSSEALPQSGADIQECSQGQEPQTINFPETPTPAPQVIAFDQQGRKSKEATNETSETDKERGKFADDFCPSRRFRQLYVLHRGEQANVPETNVANGASDEQVELTSRRNIQEQALRLLVENEADKAEVEQPEACHTAKIFDSEAENVIPIDRDKPLAKSLDQSAEETSAAPSVIGSQKNREEAEGDNDCPAATESDREVCNNESSFAAVPLSEGSIPRVCRQMFGRARVELNGIGDVLEKTIRTGHKIVGFKGTGRKCGSSTLLLGAAAELTRRGWNVLVVDGSFDHPSLASSLELTTETGWDDAVFRKAPLESAMVRIAVTAETQGENGVGQKPSFCFLPLIPQTVSRAIVASCKKDWLNKILDLSDRFDLVLVDTGSYGLDSLEEKVQEMLRFGVDGFFLVKDTRNRVNAFIPELVDQIRKVDLACLGIIENFI